MPTALGAALAVVGNALMLRRSPVLWRPAGWRPVTATPGKLIVDLLGWKRRWRPSSATGD
jgi:hypothetical protein